MKVVPRRYTSLCEATYSWKGLIARWLCEMGYPGNDKRYRVPPWRGGGKYEAEFKKQIMLATLDEAEEKLLADFDEAVRGTKLLNVPFWNIDIAAADYGKPRFLASFKAGSEASTKGYELELYLNIAEACNIPCYEFKVLHPDYFKMTDENQQFLWTDLQAKHRR